MQQIQALRFETFWVWGVGVFSILPSMVGWVCRGRTWGYRVPLYKSPTPAKSSVHTELIRWKMYPHHEVSEAENLPGAFYLSTHLQGPQPSACHPRKSRSYSTRVFFFFFRSVISDSLWLHGLYSPWKSPGQNTGVGSLSILQGIFPTQGSSRPRNLTGVSCIACGFFTSWAMKEGTHVSYIR